MPILALLVGVILIGAIIYFQSRSAPKLPYVPGAWGASADDDPRIAVAAMMVAVAIEDGPLTNEEHAQIEYLLATRLRLPPEQARDCLASGIRAAQLQSGPLNSRLHQFRPILARHCSDQEKQDAIDMLHEVAGKSGERVWSIRDALGRISASLLANDR